MIIILISDWEAILQKMDPHDDGNTQNVQEHIPCGYAYQICSPIPEFCTKVKIYRGEDCVNHFLDRMDMEYKRVKPILDQVTPMTLTEEDRTEISSATHCSICFKDLEIEELGHSVMDHDHVTGKFRLKKDSVV